MIQSLQQAIGHGGKEVFDVVPGTLRNVLLDRAWADRKDRNGQPFRSFEAFATHMLWQGLESSISDLLLYCRNRSDVAELIRREVGAADTPSEAGAKGGKGNKAVDSIKSLGGTDPTYTLRRLKRDHPELAEKVVAGKLSAHAAAIEAGFRQPTFAVSAADPDAAVAALIRKFGRAAVLTAIERADP